MKLIVMCIIFTISASCFCFAVDKTPQPLPFPKGKDIDRIIKRNNLQQEGRKLAEYGRYEEALDKYRSAMDPSLLNNDGDRSNPLCSIRDIYKYQGKFKEALELNEKEIVPRNPDKDEYVEASMELRALIRSSDMKNYKPIYDYIAYLKDKDGKRRFGPDSHVDTMIFLYDYMKDYDSGIMLMEDLIKYHTQHPNANHRSANAKRVKEYQRVKEAWELDKKTGKHEIGRAHV